MKYKKLCNIGHVTKNGNTALIICCSNKLENIALNILDSELCKIDHVNKYNNNALYYAQKNQMDNVIVKLTEYNEKFNNVNKKKMRI